MRTDTLERKFNEMGASVEFKDKRARDAHRRRLNFYHNHSGRMATKPTLPERPTIDVQTRGKDEIFIVDKLGSRGEIQVLDVQANAKHLLLMFKEHGEHGKYDVSKFLCGHDERHWFVAAVPESAGAKNVEDAMNALKPEEVVESQKKKKVKRKNRHKRKNEGYIRQGEWFFVPVPNLDTKDLAIHKDEPINRGQGSTSHICEELVRIGGTQVYVNRELAPNGVTKKEFDKLIKDDRENRWKGGGWRTMMRDVTAYARGFVKHPDHKTIHLDGWHKVVMNLENKAKAMQMVVFLD